MTENTKTFIKFALIYGIGFGTLTSLIELIDNKSIFILRNIIGGVFFGLLMSYFKLRSEKKRMNSTVKTPPPPDEYLIAAALKGMRKGRRDAILPDFSNLEAHMKRGGFFLVDDANPEDVRRAVDNFAGDSKTFADNYVYLPYDIHPVDGEDNWDEKSIKDYVNDMKRKGFGYYGHITQNGWPFIVLSKKKSSVNTLDISKRLDANQFWNDYYANYVPW